MRKIAFFGGSFNPIHNGHLKIISKILKDNIADKVLIVPCGNHAFGKELLSGKERLELIRLAIGENSKLKISDIEINSKEKSYTANTLRKLKEQTDNEYYIVIGADNIGSLDKWHDFLYLKDNFEFIIFKRPDYPVDNMHKIKIKAIVELNEQVSSSEIRDKLHKDLSIEGLVPKSVEEYIILNGLYR